MKKIAYLMLLPLFAGLQPTTAETASSDTTFTYHNKMVNIEDSIGQVKVKVYDTSVSNDTVPYKKVYEGIYSDTKSYENWTVMEEIGFQIPLFGKRFHHRDFKMDSHWAGLGFGFVNVTDAFLNLSSMDGFAVNTLESHEFFFNFSEITLPIFRNNLGITTGMGFDWRNYHFDDNRHLVETDGVTSTTPAPEGVKYEYSRLRTVYFTIPLLLEWQPNLGGNKCSYLAAGVIGGVRTLASSKVKYDDANGHDVKIVEGRGMNVAPFCLDYVAMAGIGNFGLYAKYSPFGLFEKEKGPEVRAVSIGVMLGF